MFVPGKGQNCQATSSNQAPTPGSALHFHVDTKGYLRVFNGAAEQCPDGKAYMRNRMKELIAEERAEPHPDK